MKGQSGQVLTLNGLCAGPLSFKASVGSALPALNQALAAILHYFRLQPLSPTAF